MKVTKKSNLVFGRQDDTKYKSDLDTDIKLLTIATNGKLRFGDGASGSSGENVSGQFVEFESHASANTEFAVAHTMGAVPVGFIVLWKSGAGDLYQSPTNGTDWTKTNVYLKCSASSITFKVFLLK